MTSYVTCVDATGLQGVITCGEKYEVLSESDKGITIVLSDTPFRYALLARTRFSACFYEDVPDLEAPDDDH